MFNSVRARLTLWYVGVLSIVLVTFSAGVYLLLARSLYERMDARLGATLETAALALKPVLGRTSDAQGIPHALEELRLPNQTVAILDAGGRVLAQKTGPGGPRLRLPEFNPSQGTAFYELAESGPDADDGCRGVFRRLSPEQSTSYWLVVSEPMEPLDEQLDVILNNLYVAVPVILALTAIGGWFLARRSLAPVAAMSERAQRISAQNMDERLPIGNPRDELGQLATTLNGLLARLGNSFAQQRQFMADASHELRTPLSAICTASAVILERTSREEREYREALTIIEQQSRRLTRIVEDMFVLARADAGHRSLQKSKFYFDELLSETVRAAAVLAAQKSVEIKISPLSESPFFGDEDLLRQMIWNLLDNAIRHTPEKGNVQVVLEGRDGEYISTISDTGSGIPSEIQPHIFERFYRGDQARSRSGADSGAGLGLPIARWIAEAHQGRIELRRSDATGSTFVVVLPR